MATPDRAAELASAWSASPMLATPGIGTQVPEGPQWRYEFKWDGVRALLGVRPDEAGGVTINARSGTDITVTYPEIADLGAGLLKELGTSVRLDGEIVAFDAAGRPSFEALQGRMAVNSLRRARGLASQIPVAYMVFDVLVLDDQVTMTLPYDERRRLLETLPLQPPPSLHAPDVTGAQVLAIAREQGLEGLVRGHRRLGRRPARPDRSARGPAGRRARRGRPVDLRRPGRHRLHQQGAGRDEAAARAARDRPVRLCRSR
jgi:bifunctional non-homologous end joining protein LigD